MRTPGEWVYQDHRLKGTGFEDWNVGLTIRDRRNICLAQVGHVDAAVIDDALDNARLMAAAPKLLAACQNARALLSTLGRDVTELTEAIKAATRDNSLSHVSHQVERGKYV